MRWLVSLILVPILLMGSFSARAQSALDRVDPARLEQNKVEDAAAKAATVRSAPQTPGAAMAEDVNCTIGAIEIRGLKQLSNSDFSDIIQIYIGRSLDRADITALVEKLAERARQNYPLATARIAPQEIAADMLRVDLDEGRIDGVELEGFANRRVRAILESLVTDRPVTSEALERALLLARDIDGISIRETTIQRKGERNILFVKGSYARFRGQVAIDNDSTRPIGPFEIFGSIRANGVLTEDDSLQAYFLVAAPQPDELAFLRLGYARRVDRAGTEMSVAGSFSRSRPGSYLSPLRLDGNSRWASVRISRPLERSVRSSVWLEGSLSFREFRQDAAGLLARLDRLAVARARLLGSARLGGGTLRSSATLSRGLGILGATRNGDPRSSRSDADGVFTALQLDGQWSRPIAGPLGIALGVRSQIATRPLLVSEEIGLGGARYARGYDYRERSGDQGTLGYLELSYDIARKVGPFNGLTPYAFVDGGKVTNLASGRGGGSLLSAGGGFRFDVDKRTDASFEAAAPLSGPRYETGTRGARLRVSLTRYF